MPSDNHTKSKKAYLVSLKHKLKKHLQLQSASVTQADRRWLNGFMAAGFHSGLISLTELKLEYIKAYRMPLVNVLQNQVVLHDLEVPQQR